MQGLGRKVAALALAALIGSGICVSRCTAQEAPGPNPHLANTAAPAGQATTQPAAGPAATELSPMSACPGLDFWIVSNRCCPQSGCARCSLNCPFDYFYVGGSGQLVRSDAGGFAQWLQPGVPVCLVVHGSLVSWESLLRDAGPIFLWLRNAAPERPLQVVFYDWPSDTPIVCPSIDFIRLGRRARYNGFYLSRLITQIPPQSPISFFGHSHGASVVASAMHLLAGGSIRGERLWFGDTAGRRYRAIFAAAAIEQDWLNPNETFARALCPPEALLNVYNSTDLALCLYPWRYPFSDPALGRAGFARESLRRIGPPAAKVAEMNVSHLLVHGHMWENYYAWPQIASAMVPWVYFADANPAVETVPPVPAGSMLESSAHSARPEPQLR